MTSPVQGKVEASNHVLSPQPTLLSAKKTVDAAVSLGSMVGSNQSSTQMPVVTHTPAVRKVNLSTIISEGKEPPIAILPEGAIEVRPHMIAFEAFTQRVSKLENDLEKALAANKTTEWNDDEIEHLETIYDKIIEAIAESHDVSGVCGTKGWQHRVICNKAQKLNVLLASLVRKHKEVAPDSYL